MHRLCLCITLICALSLACGSPSRDASKPQPADTRVRELADAYLNAYFERYPETSTIFGVPGRHHDKLSDNSLAALRDWEGREDAFLNQARAVDPRTIQDPRLRATYAIVREALESAVATRVCHAELWNVSQMQGWHTNLGYLVTIQPVGTDDARREALARWSALPKYIDTEIANLREGIKQGYTAPKLNVRIVIDQVGTIAKSRREDSPFDSPSQRDASPEFKKQFAALVADQINPAAQRYIDFLQREYLPAAREHRRVGDSQRAGLLHRVDSLRQHAAEVCATGPPHRPGADGGDHEGDAGDRGAILRHA